MVIGKIFQHFFSNTRGLSFVQIGANDGVYQDMLHWWVEKYGWHGVLVEPIAERLEDCKRNYAGCGGLVFECCAIADEAGERDFYYAPITDVSSALEPVWARIEKYLHEGHYKKRRVPCVTIMDLFEKHGIVDLDVLCIDAEGYDGKIVLSLDLSVIRPKVIIYEERNKGRKIPEREAVLGVLVGAGYKLTRYKNNRIAYRTSVKIPWDGDHIR